VLVAGGLSLSDAYAAVYGRRPLRRSESKSASRVAASPAVQFALGQIAIQARGATYLDRLKTRARARLANDVLREAGHDTRREAAWRADVLARRERRTFAWRLFLQAVLAIGKAKAGAPSFLPPQERTRLLFEYFAPVLPVTDVAAGVVSGAVTDAVAGEEKAELEELVEARRAGRRLSTPPPVAEPEPEPGCFPPPLPPPADGVAPSPPPAGRREFIPIAGRFPPARRRVWIPNAGKGDSAA
jgi:hypothetical protein